VAVCRLANQVTLCDGHEIFVAACGQIRMAAKQKTSVAHGFWQLYP
jgi:hypothetical protein